MEYFLMMMMETFCAQKILRFWSRRNWMTFRGNLMRHLCVGAVGFKYIRNLCRSTVLHSIQLVSGVLSAEAQ